MEKIFCSGAQIRIALEYAILGIEVGQITLTTYSRLCLRDHHAGQQRPTSLLHADARPSTSTLS
jgi:hypothetical protein